MTVADRYGQRIGRVVWRWNGIQSQQEPDHLLYLALLGTPVPDDAHFDFQRGVFKDCDACLGGSKESHTAGVSEFKGRLHIRGVKDFLDCHDVDLLPRKNLSQSQIYLEKTCVEWLAGDSFNCAIGDGSMS